MSGRDSSNTTEVNTTDDSCSNESITAQAAYRLYRTLTAAGETSPHIRNALSTLEAAFRLYTPDNLAVAFNGGKDATVVMHLARAAVASWSVENRRPAVLHCLYLLGKPGEQFPEIDRFVREQVKECGLDGVEVQLGIKEGIEQFVKDRGSICAFVMGTRRSDPHSETLERFEPSSKGWPAFMRVNPILSWDYQQIWEFLRRFELPYCPLYDCGYTSIGSVCSTSPNPALREEKGGVISYRPAWTLEDASLERAGRCRKAT